MNMIQLKESLQMSNSTCGKVREEKGHQKALHLRDGSYPKEKGGPWEWLLNCLKTEVDKLPRAYKDEYGKNIPIFEVVEKVFCLESDLQDPPGYVSIWIQLES